MIAQYRIDGFGESLKGQVELLLVVLHSSRRVDHVGGNHQELDFRALPHFDEPVPQYMLRRIALAWIANHQDAEIRARGDLLWGYLEQLGVQRIGVTIPLADRVYHLLAPGVG